MTDDPGAAAEAGRGGAGERAENLRVVVLGVFAPGTVRAQPVVAAGQLRTLPSTNSQGL